MRTIAYLLSFSLILVAISLGSSVLEFIDIPSIVLTIGVTVLLGYHRFGADLLRLFDKTHQQRHHMADWLSRTCFHAGLLSAIVGYLQIAGSLTDITALGPALTIASLPILYAYLMFFFVFKPIADQGKVKVGT